MSRNKKTTAAQVAANYTAILDATLAEIRLMALNNFELNTSLHELPPLEAAVHASQVAIAAVCSKQVAYNPVLCCELAALVLERAGLYVLARNVRAGGGK